MSGSVLSVRDLTVRAHLDSGPRTLLDAVSLDLGRGEILGLVGESGSGKSLFCRSLVRLLPSSLLKIESGSVLLEGRDLTRIDDAEMLKVRGGEIGMIFQNPTSHLDPVMRVATRSPRASATIRALAPARPVPRQWRFSRRSLSRPRPPVRQLSA